MTSVSRSGSAVLSGNDTVTSGSGNDYLLGYAGDDTVSSQGGDDSLEGGPGKDTLNGGPGFDTAVFSSPQSDYTVLAAPMAESRSRTTRGCSPR